MNPTGGDVRTTRHSEHHRHLGSGDDPEVFRRLFWANLILAVPVLVFSDQIQDWFGHSIDGAWAAWVAPVLGTVIYAWGGSPSWPAQSLRPSAAGRG